MPVNFGGIPVCLGPCIVNWPADDVLLRALRPPAGGLGHLSRRALSCDRKVLLGVVAAVAAVVMFGEFISAMSKPNEDPRAALQAARAAVQRRVDATLPHRLTVSVRDAGLVVDGIVDTPEQRHAVLAGLDSAPTPVPIGSHLSVASDVAESIRSALGLAGARVAYRGAGVFHVSVEAPDAGEAHAALDRIASDLKPVVSRIESDIRPRILPPDLPAVRSAMSADGVSVMETRDGVKHLVLVAQNAAMSASALAVVPQTEDMDP